MEKVVGILTMISGYVGWNVIRNRQSFYYLCDRRLFALVYLISNSYSPYIYVSFRLVKKSKVKCESRQSEVSFMLDYSTTLMHNVFRREYKKPSGEISVIT